MKIATWNVNGIRARQAQVESWLAAEQPDVVCLQEVKATVEQIPITLYSLSDYWSFWHCAGPYSGVTLLVKRSLGADKPVFAHPDFDHENRIVTARLGDLELASIYVPNGGKDFAAKIRFLEAMARYVATATAAATRLVLCGDLNVARAEIDVHPKERKNVTGQLPEERALFQRILDAGVVNLGRALDPTNEELYSWWAPWRNMRQRNIGWRLDYVLASTVLAEKTRSCKVQREVGTSDHGPVIAEIDV